MCVRIAHKRCVPALTIALPYDDTDTGGTVWNDDASFSKGFDEVFIGWRDGPGGFTKVPVALGR